MKTKIAWGLLAAMILSVSVTAASPITNEQGRWNIEAGAMFTHSNDLDYDNGYAIDLDGDTSFYGAVTYNINDKWGIQLDYSHYDSAYDFGDSYQYENQLDATEVNLLYRLDPKLDLFFGYVYAGVDIDYTGKNCDIDIDSAHIEGIQFGVMGRYPLNNKLKTFGKLALGDHSRIYELGLSYAITNRWNVNLSYRDAQYQDLADFTDISYDGLRLGISTSF